MTESRSVVAWGCWGWGGEEWEGTIIKGQEKTYGGGGCVHYLDCGNGSRGEHVCQNSSDCVF